MNVALMLAVVAGVVVAVVVVVVVAVVPWAAGRCVGTVTDDPIYSHPPKLPRVVAAAFMRPVPSGLRKAITLFPSCSNATRPA